jgi:hypothetical protein
MRQKRNKKNFAEFVLLTGAFEQIKERHKRGTELIC